MRAWVPVTALVAALLVAPASAEVGIINPDHSTPTTLYFHLDANQDFPINTQPPDDRYAADSGRGVLAPTTSCVPEGAPEQARKDFHTLYGFSTPGYVEYDFQEDGGPRIHPERGLAESVSVDTSAETYVMWYVKTQFTGGDSRLAGLEADDTPAVIPQFAVEVTIREGDAVSIGAEAYNAGALLAHGKSTPMDLHPQAAAYREQADGSHVYEIMIPITWQEGLIDKEESFNIRVDMEMEVPTCNEDPDAALMTSQVRVFTDPDFRPRLETAIYNPLRLEYLHPQFVGEQLFVHTGITSPWGNYDVDESEEGTSLEITGPSPAQTVIRHAPVQRHHEHGFHFEPVAVTYVWPYKLDEASCGDYELEFSARNDQANAVAVGRATFDPCDRVAIDGEGNEVLPIADGESSDTPAVGVVLVGLAALALARRRR